MPDITQNGRLIIQAQHTFKQQYFPSEGHGKIQGCEGDLVQEVPVAIRMGAAEDYPVVAKLLYGEGNETRIEIRQGPDGFYRTLLAPDEVPTPCDIERLRLGLMGDCNWVDDPVRGRPRSNREIEPRARRSVPPDWRVRKFGTNQKADAEAAFRRKLERIIVIDDMAYVRCTEPKIIVRMLADAVRVPYSMTDIIPGEQPLTRLDGDDDEIRGPTVIKPFQYSQAKGDRKLGDRSDLEADWRLFPLGRFECARKFALALASEQGQFAKARPDLVSELDASVFPDSTRMDFSRDDVRLMIRSIGNKANDLPDDIINMWQKARREAYSDCPDLSLALDAIAEIRDACAARNLSSPISARESKLLLRWTEIERELAMRPIEAPELAGLTL